MKGISFYYRHLNIQYRYLVFDPPGLGTHCGLVWSELCTQAWGVQDQISILYFNVNNIHYIIGFNDKI